MPIRGLIASHFSKGNIAKVVLPIIFNIVTTKLIARLSPQYSHYSNSPGIVRVTTVYQELIHNVLLTVLHVIVCTCS